MDPDTLDTAGVASVDVLAGRYTYQFSEVPEGEYVVVAGTDLDNDFTICDNGEACGAYPTLDSALAITVDRDITGLDFLTGFATSLGPGSLSVDSAAASGFSREAERRLTPR